MADPTTKVTTASAAIVHVSNGASVAAAAFSSAFDSALSFTGNLLRYPRCDVVLFMQPSASVAVASTNIYLYRRDMNIDGTADEDIPSASNRAHFCGAFQVSASAASDTSHYMMIADVPLTGSADCEFYIENALGTNVKAGWTLKVLPKSDVGATS